MAPASPSSPASPCWATIPRAAATALTRAIKASGARLVLIDGFQGLADLFDDPRTVRRLLARLAALVTVVDVTLVITLQGHGRDPALAAALTTADAVIGLDYQVEGLRHRRHLEVIKQRGQAPLPGLHPYSITAAGHIVFPRLEARPLPVPRPRPGGRPLRSRSSTPYWAAG